jgi:Flp pilus assembly protein TadB
MSHIVLRVPQGEYDAVLRDLAGAGKLLSRTSSAKDVTGQVVDVESRIATQRASVARVRKLMDQAEKLTDVVALEGELSSRQASLESLLAQQESLKDRTTLATITLDLSEPETVAKDGDDAPGFLDALGGGWHAFVTMLRWLAMALGAAAPFLATAAVLLLLWRLLLGRLRGRRVPRTPEQSEPSSTPPAS